MLSMEGRELTCGDMEKTGFHSVSMDGRELTCGDMEKTGFHNVKYGRKRIDLW